MAIERRPTRPVQIPSPAPVETSGKCVPQALVALPKMDVWGPVLWFGFDHTEHEDCLAVITQNIVNVRAV